VSSPRAFPSSITARAIAQLVRAGRHCFPRRIAVGAAGLALGMLVVRPRNLFGEFEAPASLVSFTLVLVGLALRAWAAAAAGLHTRSATIEAPRLATGGPYAFVRNPIYLGSFVLGLGMVGLLRDPWLLVPHLFVFGIFFGVIVPAEEQFLEAEFGAEFVRFRRAVPRFIPALRPWSGRMERGLAWRAALGEAWIAVLLVTIYAAFRMLLHFQTAAA
jgi:protein-S-isoprenylcysteine O-methyltransferase Ste14